MTENDRQCQIIFPQELLQVVWHARETGIDNLLTNDESWFSYDCAHDLALAPWRATLPIPTPRPIQTKKCLVSCIWSAAGTGSLLALSARLRYDAEFFCPSVLPDFEKNIYEGSRRKSHRRINLHADNARAHNAKQLQQEIA
jgi:hypothetical protein